MKVIVVYKSKTGFTKRYAEWIGGELGCPAIPITEASPETVGEYDLVVYGGSVHAGIIGGFKKASALARKCGKRLVVFATGATPAGAEAIDAMWKANLVGTEADTPHFYMQSGLDYEKMSAFDRCIMKLLSAMMAKKKNKTDDEIGTQNAISSSYDISSKDYVNPLVEYIKKVGEKE